MCNRFFLILVSVAVGSVLQVDHSFLVAHSYEISIKKLYPKSVLLMNPQLKPRLAFGSPDRITAHQIEFFDSHPVEHRIQYIRGLMKGWGKFFPPNLTRNIHSEYPYTSRFIDLRVLKLLIRIATKSRHADETHIATACDVITFLRNKYPHVSFGYLTPQYILDWYDIIGHPHRIRLEGTRNEYSEADEKFSQPILLQLRRNLWEKVFLAQRLDRLEQTGYESFF